VDVVMGTSPPIFQAFSAWIVAAVRRRPFLLEIRDLWPEFIIDMGKLRNPLLIRVSRWFERFLYRRADHLLVNSPAYVDYLISRGVPAEKITLVANGVDPTMFDPQADGHIVRHRLNLDGKVLVVYAGAMGPANDLDTLLDAAAELKSDPHVCFLMVGSGKLRNHLEARARELGLKNVLFAGAQPKQSIPDFLAVADICVATLQNIPMFRMTYPNKVFDYMAAGRPVVLAIEGVIQDVVEAAAAGLCVPPGDPASLAGAIRFLIANQQRRQEMSRSGRKYVEAHFNRRDQARQFVQLLGRVVAQDRV